MKSNRLFAKRAGQQADGTIASLREELTGVGIKAAENKEISSLVISTESFSKEQQSQVQGVTSDLRTEIEDAVKRAGYTKENGYSFEDHNIDAAVMGALLVGDGKAVMKKELTMPTGIKGFFNQASEGSTSTRLISTESYDEKSFSQNSVNTIMYNLLASVQDEFSADFFPLMTIETTVAGVEIEAHVTYVYNDFIHSTNGSLANLERKDVLGAYVDDSILENDLTAAIPIYRPNGSGANPDSFVDPKLVPVQNYDFGSGIKGKTLPLVMDKEHNLIGLSQTDRQLVGGVANYTDTLSHVVELKYLYVTDGTETYRIDCTYKEGARFQVPLQGDTRRITLDFFNNDCTIARGTKTVLDADGVDADFFDNNVRLSLRVNGSCYLDTGKTSLYGAQVAYENATDKDNNEVTAAVADKLKTKIANLKVVGYVLKAFKTNENLRQLGQLVEDKTYLMFARVPYHTPLSVVSSTYETDRDDNKAIARLVTLANLNSSNRSVKRAFEICDYLRSYINVPDAEGNRPKIDIIGSRYMKPTFYEETISINDILDSLTSTDRNEDFGNALVNRFRTAGLFLLENSEILPAGRFITGNQNFKPTLVIGTDIQLASYLVSEFGEKVEFKEFNMRFSSTLNSRMRGKVMMSFSILDKGEACSKVGPFTPGVFIQSPELVSSMDRTIDNATSHITIVTPRNLHLWTQPVWGLVHFEDLPTVSTKLKLHVETYKSPADVEREEKKGP